MNSKQKIIKIMEKIENQDTLYIVHTNSIFPNIYSNNDKNFATAILGDVKIRFIPFSEQKNIDIIFENNDLNKLDGVIFDNITDAKEFQKELFYESFKRNPYARGDLAKWADKREIPITKELRASVFDVRMYDLQSDIQKHKKEISMLVEGYEKYKKLKEEVLNEN